MTNTLSNINPKLVFNYFSEISQIPRGSKNERAISDYLVATAKGLGLEVIQDEVLNVIIKKPATPGYENVPGVILQGHMDMVCEKNKDTDHDFEKDPIQLRVDGDYLYANNTTLGADNGIAVAMGLAILASDDLRHPALEVVFTSDEEEGMTGAMNLNGELFNGKYIINIDAEEEGVILVSCAGGVTALASIPKEVVAADITKTAYCIDIKGLLGGHSGMEIHQQRANANVLMGRLLYALSTTEGLNYDLAYIQGGAKNNAIPRESECVVLIDETQQTLLVNTVLSALNIFKNEFKTSDPGIVITCTKCTEAIEAVFSSECKDKVVELLNVMPNGIQTMSMDIEGLVESSTNMGVVCTTDEAITLEFATRSSVKSLKDNLNSKMTLLCNNIGAKLELLDDYPEWEYAKDSQLEKICVDVYANLTGKKPVVTAIHAGLECGLLLNAIKGAQAVSIGPNLYDVHTPNEHLSISSTQNTWDYLVSILENMK